MTRIKHKTAMILYAILLLFGLALGVWAISQYHNSNYLVRTGTITEATVSDLLVNYDSDGNTYTSVFTYIDKKKTPRTFTSSISSSPAPYDVGEKVKVVYNPEDFKEVKVVSYWGLYRWTVVLLCIAAPFVIIGGGYFYYWWR